MGYVTGPFDQGMGVLMLQVEHADLLTEIMIMTILDPVCEQETTIVLAHVTVRARINLVRDRGSTLQALVNNSFRRDL
jgi:hypothetical protein